MLSDYGFLEALRLGEMADAASGNSSESAAQATSANLFCFMRSSLFPWFDTQPPAQDWDNGGTPVVPVNTTLPAAFPAFCADGGVGKSIELQDEALAADAIADDDNAIAAVAAGRRGIRRAARTAAAAAKPVDAVLAGAGVQLVVIVLRRTAAAAAAKTAERNVVR